MLLRHANRTGMAWPSALQCLGTERYQETGSSAILPLRQADDVRNCEKALGRLGNLAPAQRFELPLTLYDIRHWLRGRERCCLVRTWDSDGLTWASPGPDSGAAWAPQSRPTTGPQA